MPEGSRITVIVRWIVHSKSKLIKSVNYIHICKIDKSKMKEAVPRYLHSVSVAVAMG